MAERTKFVGYLAYSAVISLLIYPVFGGWAILAMLTAWVIFKKPDASMALNGALAGLVAITAPCASVTPAGALAIGGLLYGGGLATYELSVKLSYDDRKLFDTDSTVLSPYVYYALDYDAGECGSWLELGVSHDFAVHEHVTVTPSVALGVDIHYLDKFAVAGNGGETSSTRLANILYGLNVSYDLSGALNLPPQIGSVTISGFLNYSQPFRDELLNDEFFGGMNVGWSW